MCAEVDHWTTGPVDQSLFHMNLSHEIVVGMLCVKVEHRTTGSVDHIWLNVNLSYGVAVR